jgi:hypothetical protein
MLRDGDLQEGTTMSLTIKDIISTEAQSRLLWCMAVQAQGPMRAMGSMPTNESRGTCKEAYSPDTFGSCPTTKLCVVVTGENELITSTEPTGGTNKWTVSQNKELESGGFTSLTCESETLCVVDYTVAEDSSFIYSSTNPTGGWTDWSKTGTANWLTGLTGPSCPTSSLCVAGKVKVHDLVHNKTKADRLCRVRGRKESLWTA